MAIYHLTQTYKTRFFNLFRRVFTISLFERFLVTLTVQNPSGFVRKLIPPDYLYRKNSLRYVQRSGIHYKLDISNVVDHYLYYGVKDADYTAVLDVLKRASVILDIGANIGTTSLYFASINSTAQILGFEPHPHTFKRAQENIQLNAFANIQILNLGLGEKKDTLKLYEVNEHNPGMNRIVAEEINLPFQTIEINTLDTVLEEKKITNVDFIKLDVEGFEYFVLAGGLRTLQRSKPVLFIELDDDNLREHNKSAQHLLELLASAGYSTFYRADTLVAVSPLDCFDHCHFDVIAK